ncbi:MAG: VOC family protein [Acidimicrobiales bacterium]
MNVTSHTPGMPVWVDVMAETTDQRHQLMAFYELLFGWSFDEGPEEMSHYTIASHDHQAVMGFVQAPGGAGQMTTYFGTDDVDASLARARELGATPLMEPIDVTDVGRMAMVADPAGAVHGLWQAGTFAGFGQVYEVGAPGWFDHASDTPDVASDYYVGLTGMTLTEPDPSMKVLSHGEQWFASFSHNQVPQRTAQWNALYITDSLERLRETVTRQGGTVLVAEMPVPGSAITVFSEPVMNTVVTVMRAGEPA